MITSQNLPNLNNACSETISLITPSTKAISNLFLVKFASLFICTSLSFHEDSVILQSHMIVTIISQVGSINHQLQRYNTF